MFKACFLLVGLCALLQYSSTHKVDPKNQLKFQLLGGDLMPLIGYGTYLVKSGDVESALDKALGAGYRLIDTAKVYENEEAIGKALKVLLPKYKLSRSDIFITSKLSSHDQGDKAYEALKESLRKLQLEYLDLYLIHGPISVDAKDKIEPDSAAKRDKSWQHLVKAHKEGLVKNIGVSNYNTKQLGKLLENDHGIKPAVNQIEWHPFWNQPEFKKLLDKEGILLQAYFSLGGTGNKDLIGNDKVVKIAQELKRSPAQVLLRWSVQQNIGVIPKALSQKHIDENIDLDFVIPAKDMAILNGLPQHLYGFDTGKVE